MSYGWERWSRYLWTTYDLYVRAGELIVSWGEWRCIAGLLAGSKLLLVVFTNRYWESICRIKSCMQIPADVLIYSDNGTTASRGTAVGASTWSSLWWSTVILLDHLSSAQIKWVEWECGGNHTLVTFTSVVVALIFVVFARSMILLSVNYCLR